MALRGIRVIELAGMIPAPFCGMILAEFGANVIHVDKVGSNLSVFNSLNHGKKSILLNLKQPDGVNIFKQLAKDADVLIEPYRPGKMESLGLGPEVLQKINTKLIYARLSGYGQYGFYSKYPGHDINFLALSGLLSIFRNPGQKPVSPSNIAADLSGGALMCTIGVLMALNERNSSGLGQLLDANIADGLAYLASLHYRTDKCFITGKGLYQHKTHFYNVYKTKDGKYMSVAPVELKFYKILLKGLGLQYKDAPMDGNYEDIEKIFSEKFLEKTRDEWCEIFNRTEACVVPVLSRNEAPRHLHYRSRESFLKTDYDDRMIPKPSPRLSRTPGVSKIINNKPHIHGQHTEEILRSINFSDKEIRDLAAKRIIQTYKSPN